MKHAAKSEKNRTFLARTSAGLPGRRASSRRPGVIACQICGEATVAGLDLGVQPVSDLVLTEAELNRPETFYPMRLQHCPSCGLTQLSYVVDPKIVYKNFPFVSGTTKTATRHLQSLPKDLVKRMGLDRNSFAVDIGSNDGTLLKGYIPSGVRFVGVDPAGDPVKIANENGIETLHLFFNEATAEFLRDSRGQADAITACGVFGHIADLHSVMRGVKTLLARKGMFVTDNQYWLSMVENLHYDNMFHQHLRYYSLKPMIALFRQYDLEVFDVERSNVYGGSIRVFACHKGDYPIHRRVKNLAGIEESAALYETATHERFREAVEQKRRILFDRVYELARQGKKVVGIGAPAKATTICNYCRLGPDLVAYMTEVNPLLIGKYLPGVHIPIRNENEMFEDDPPPDAGILFAWNYYDEIVPKLRKRGFEGEILLP